MIRNCSHPDADAINHPECATCAMRMALRAAVAEIEHRAHCARSEALWSAEPRPIEDVLRTELCSLERQAQTERELDAATRRSLLDPLPDPAAEARAVAAARDDTERPGTWYGDEGADGRQLTQDQTDCLIRDELFWLSLTLTSASAEIEAAIGPRSVVALEGLPYAVNHQRGGIDSDPLVRLLAYRAWGERDRRWFEDRGVRKGDRVRLLWNPLASGRPPAVLAWGHEVAWGVASVDAWPGQLVEVRSLMFDAPMFDDGRMIEYRVGDRLRAELDEVDDPHNVESAHHHKDPRKETPPIELLRGYLGFDERTRRAMAKLHEEERLSPIDPEYDHPLRR